MRRSSRLAPGRRKVKPRVPDAVRQQVRERTHGKCHLCLYQRGVAVTMEWLLPLDETRPIGPATMRGAKQIAHLHHCFTEQKFPELIAEPANLIGLCFDCHLAHHRPGVNDTRIPLAALMPETLALADDDGPRLNYLDRAYAGTATGAEPRPEPTEDHQHG